MFLAYMDIWIYGYMDTWIYGGRCVQGTQQTEKPCLKAHRESGVTGLNEKRILKVKGQLPHMCDADETHVEEDIKILNKL